ncbi:MAG: biotin--[acetyl-CoA-carboxylase] ligase [Actinomycetota bacterium]|nr:biotin--[acetyl-CoA-carboxylase] ligase [Actinomycetota bacterium]
MEDDLSEASIRRALTGRFGAPLRCLDEVGSTNTVALRWAAEEGAPEGALVVTEHQTEGRGRWGRRWLSQPGKLLQFSLILSPDLAGDDVGLLTTALGVACARGIETCTGLAARVKWPNDVTIGGRKVSGILVESVLSGGAIQTAVAGVGINVRWDQDEIPPDIAARATSIDRELGSSGGAPPRRAELLGAILAALEELYPFGDPDAVIREALTRSDVIGTKVSIRYPGGGTVSGRAVGLAPSGALRLEVDGEVREIKVGEVEHTAPGS